MPKKHKHEEHVNHERWLVSYADFITLLFATFTALFAISNADKEKFSKMAASLKNAFATDMPTDVKRIGLKGRGLKDHRKPGALTIFKDSERASGGPVSLSSKGSKSVDPKATPNPLEIEDPAAEAEFRGPGPGGPGEMGGPEAGAGQHNEGEGRGDSTGPRQGGWIDTAEKAVNKVIEFNALSSSTQLRRERRGLIISLSEDGYFEPEATDVRPEALYKLDKILSVIKAEGNENVMIEAHTDDAPLKSGIYRSLSDLSTQRALRIFEYMIQKFGFSPEKISAAGYGPYRPVDSNETEWGRRRNRRVDIVILNPDGASQQP